jgi:hypothetical protein
MLAQRLLAQRRLPADTAVLEPPKASKTIGESTNFRLLQPIPSYTYNLANMSAFRTTTRLVSRRPAAIAQSLRFAPRWMSQDAQNKLLGADLQKADPAVYDIVQKVRLDECTPFSGNRLTQS